MYGRDWNIQLQPSLDSTNTTKRMNLKTCTVKNGYKVPKTLSEIYDYFTDYKEIKGRYT